MPKPPLVFLDQNHWIYLAKSYWGAPLHPSHKGVATDLCEHILRGDVCLPLNLIHLIEHLRNDNNARRARLAEETGAHELISRDIFLF